MWFLLSSMFLLRGSITRVKIYSAAAALLGVPERVLLRAHAPGRQPDNECHSPLCTKLPVLARGELAGRHGLTFQGEAVGQERKCQNKTSLACLQEGAEEHMLSSPRTGATSHQGEGFAFPVPAGEVSCLSNGEESTVEPVWVSESSHLEHICPPQFSLFPMSGW